MRFLKIFLLLLFPITVAASEAAFPLYEMVPDLRDKASLQRGAKTFMNYCIGCHTLKYQRYKRTAEDLGISESLMLEHLVFDPNTRIGDLIVNPLSTDNAKSWFGAIPPDLTLYTKLKGSPNYLYTYLLTFYEDPSRPFGANNLVYENVGMPHALLELQGVQQRKDCKEVARFNPNGSAMRNPVTFEYVTRTLCGDELIESGISPLELVQGSGELSDEAYRKVIYDLTNFLYYMGDPSQLERERIGGWVLLFLAFFFVPAYLLGREYKKAFH
jgi:cytochrome c1